MPRVKDKPLLLDESRFIDWLLEVYYYRMMDQGIAAARTGLMLSKVAPEAQTEFLSQVRAQLARFELTFPLTKLPSLYKQAMREVAIRPLPKPTE